MPSNTASSADNQQERLNMIGWVVGFTDGEGCFSVSVIKNPTTKSGWQAFPEFVVTQGAKSLPALQELKSFFGCGNIYPNRRADNHREMLYRYCVRSLEDLEARIIPFFSQNQLLTAKRNDFSVFAKVVSQMRKGQHLTNGGMERIAKLASTMNRKRPSRLSASSETIRRIPHLL